MNPRRTFSFLLGLAALAGAHAAQRPAPTEPATVTPAPAPAEAAPSIPAPVSPTPAAPAQPAPTSPAATTGANAKKPRAVDLKNASSMPPPPLSPRFQQVRDRIEELFRHRNETPPVFDARSNPFRAAGAVPPPPRTAATSTEAAQAPVASTTDLQLLQQASAGFKVAGTIQIGGVSHLVINQVPYKEGDVINVKVKGTPVFVRVKNISRYSFTLSLNTSELSVKY